MKYYTISEERLSQLLKKELELEALEAGGVDNWSWYDEAFISYLDREYYIEDVDQEYEQLTLEVLLKEFGESGLEINTLKIQEGDTICFTVDPDIIDITDATNYSKAVTKAFPTNNFLFRIKGIDMDYILPNVKVEKDIIGLTED